MKYSVLVLIVFVAIPASFADWRASTYRCSIIDFAGVRSPGTSFFIGESLADTAFAGPGSVQVTVAHGPFGPTVDRPVYGQVVRVERHAPDAPPRLKQHDHVIVVPWSYTPSCATAKWGRSAQFVPVGHRDFYEAILRDSVHWVSGRPTFDVHRPLAVPYPTASARRRFGKPMVSVDELYEAFTLLPLRDMLEAEDWDAAEPFLQWFRRTDTDTTAFPINEMARFLVRGAEVARTRKLSAIAAGTYRITVTLNTAVLDTFYIRTADRPSGPWWGNGYQEPTAVVPWDRRAVGYELYFWHGRRVDDLPRGSARRDQRGEWALGVSATMEEEAGEHVWRGHFELSQLTRSLPDRPVLAGALARWRTAFSERWRSGQIRPDELEFRRDMTGQIRFHGTYTIDDSVTLYIEADRVSEETIPRPW